MALLERNRLIQECWISVAAGRRPDPDPRGPHYAVAVWGVVDDPRFRLRGEAPFQDVVHWWPALGKWTVTHCGRASEEAHDYECEVSYFQPLPPLPWGL